MSIGSSAASCCFLSATLPVSVYSAPQTRFCHSSGVKTMQRENVNGDHNSRLPSAEYSAKGLPVTVVPFQVSPKFAPAGSSRY